MTWFLGTSWSDNDHVQLHWSEDPLSALNRRGGRTSPLHPVAPGVAPHSLPPQGALALLFPRSPRATLGAIQSEFPEHLLSATFMTHGLAAVVLITEGSPEDLATHLSGLEDGLVAYELWPFADKVLRPLDVTHWRSPSADLAPPKAIDASDLPTEIAIEVRQFNSNLSLFSTTIAEFAPEIQSLTRWLAQSVERRVEEIRADIRRDAADEAYPSRLHHDISILVDVNSCLTMATSQIGDVLPPVLNATYPVGEFSLLGIGSMARAAWAIYDHASSVFESANHVDQLVGAFDKGGFDPAFSYLTADYDSWSAARKLMKPAREGEVPEARKHIVLFSSRWGFHETLNAVSLSWQTISAGATREWNLLTLSHEFLHSHFRELIRAAVLNIDSAEAQAALLDNYNSEWRQPSGKTTFLQSLQIFIVNQLRWVVEAERVATVLSGGEDAVEVLTERLTAEELTEILATPLLDMVEEVIVHIMDYHYFYNGDDESYVASLWHSWTMVPFVQRKLRHYVLRTLFALASLEVTTDPEAAFKSVLNRLRRQFEDLSGKTGSRLIATALTELNDGPALSELWARFRFNYQLVLFTKTFLIDDEIYAVLVSDPEAVAGPHPQYRLEPGEFAANAVASPTAFLLDRFAVINRTTNDMEYESLWQLLILV